MKFSELDTKMRVFETAHDHQVLPGINVVVRLDGRSFTKLTKETLNLERPFDPFFKGVMTSVVKHLMTDSGVRVIYGFHESDEISLLLHPEDELFGRKERKLNSILAGEASAYISGVLARLAVFDCRVCQLPTQQNVTDYFRWRQEDAARNALTAHCYWALRAKRDMGANQATDALEGLGSSEKNELLFQLGINFNDLPLWQKRGVGLYYWDTVKPGFNPKKQEATVTTRRSLIVNEELPMRDEYNEFVLKLYREATQKPEAE